MNRIHILISLLLLVGLLAAPAMAQISPHFDLSWSLLSGGGGYRSSSHYQIDDVLSQWPDGQSRSDHYQIDPGFWHVGRVMEPSRLYMPLVLRTRP